MSILIVSGLLDKIINEVFAEQQRRHELKLKELSIIESSSLRDEYARQLLLDRVLTPVEKAQHKIQETAMHAQYLAEVINYSCIQNH